MHIPAPSLSTPEILPDPTSASLTRPTRVIAISSGKGGVGKTSVSTNLGIALAKLGAKVCILDADTGLANINILLNLRPEFTIEHLLNGEKNIDEIMLDGPDGIKVVPAASGISECAELNQEQYHVLSKALSQLESRFDYLLIDTAAGIGETVLAFLASAQYCVLVVTPEPTSLTDAFSLIRVMKRKQLKQPIYTIVNRAASPQKANEIFHRFSAATKKYLQTCIGYMGSIAEDPMISSAVYLQTPIIIAQPQSPASQCIQALAIRIDNKLIASKKPHHFSKYWHDKRQPGSDASDISAPKIAPDTASSTALSGDYLSVAILSYLQYPETSKGEAKQLLQPLIDAGLERFGAAVFNLPAAAEPAKTTTSAQIPTAGTASNISRLVSDIEEPEATQIIQQLVSRHKRLFNKSPLDLEDTFTEILCQTEMNETQCSAMLETLRQYYREHFGDYEQDEKTKLIETFAEFSQQIQQREKQLDNDLQRLSDIVKKFSDAHM
ncbi:MAG: MinD/ParA family protein [Gammaproteobacteria bacterium]|nr:MinD/ParA family protein [Gammaproteobacteria bacterium]